MLAKWLRPMYPPNRMGRDRTLDGLDKTALVDGRYDTRMFKIGPKMKSIMAQGRMMAVRQDTQRRIVLPNGHVVKVSADASGVATQIEDDNHQHAVIRPHTYVVKLHADGSVEDDPRQMPALARWAQQQLDRYGKRGRRGPK